MTSDSRMAVFTYLLIVILSVRRVMGETDNVTAASTRDPTATPPVDTPTNRNIYDQLDSSLYYIYDMVIFFLEHIIQTNVLTEMNEYINPSVQIFSQFTTYWDKWFVYLIGFVVCAAVGVVLAISMLLTGPVIGCSRCCCSNCRKKVCCCCKTSRCGCVGCSLVLVVLCGCVLMGAIPMITFNDRLYEQIRSQYLRNVDQGLVETIDYLDRAVTDIDTVCYDGYVQTETEVFSMLDGVPSDVLKLIDNSTGVVGSMYELSNFTAQLLPLLGNLTAAEEIATSLEQQSSLLWENFSAVVIDINNTLQVGCTTPCGNVTEMLNSAHLVANFSQVELHNSILAVQDAINKSLDAVAQNISTQINGIPTAISNQMAPSIESAKGQSESAKQSIRDAITSLNDSLTAPVIDLHQTVSGLFEDELMKSISIGIYCGILIGIIVLILIASLYVVGVILGAVMPYNKTADNEKKGCCTKSLGSWLLMTSNVLIFVFYWLFALVLAALFVAGGLIQTEACRHAIHFDDPASSAVLNIFDEYIAKQVQIENYELRAFKTYAECSKNVAMYTAFNLSQNPEWALTINYEQIQNTVNNIKGTTFDIGHVDITNPSVDAMLMSLDQALTDLNFTAIYLSVNTTIIYPDINELVIELEKLNISALSTSISQLQNLTYEYIEPMQEDQQQLMTSLGHAQGIIADISFEHIANTLNKSEAFVNTNGSDVTSLYVNSTADMMYLTMTKFANDTTDKMTNEVAKCQPLYVAVTTLIDANCVTALYPVNGFWYNLGWCLFFLLPSFALAMSLSTMFRQLKPNKSKKARAPSNCDVIVASQSTQQKVNPALAADPIYTIPAGVVIRAAGTTPGVPAGSAAVVLPAAATTPGVNPDPVYAVVVKKKPPATDYIASSQNYDHKISLALPPDYD